MISFFIPLCNEGIAVLHSVPVCNYIFLLLYYMSEKGMNNIFLYIYMRWDIFFSPHLIILLLSFFIYLFIREDDDLLLRSSLKKDSNVHLLAIIIYRLVIIINIIKKRGRRNSSVFCFCFLLLWLWSSVFCELSWVEWQQHLLK